MRAVIVFDSMFGNTHEIAEAVAEGLVAHARVDLYTVDNTGPDLYTDVDLLVVGGPTHGHGLSRRTSRQVSAKYAAQGATPSRLGLREWLDSVPTPSQPVAVATFDTRFDKPAWLTGSAARQAAKRLRRHGYVLVAPPESFFVDSGTGPLQSGEADRARRWGALLGATAAATIAPRPGPR
jgi:hypothetical protein